MTDTPNLPSHVRDSLARLAESSDRASPTVFAGREDEFDLLNAAVRGAQRGEPGHTVVIHGVPGAGKTALLNEYAARLLAADGGTEKPTIAVPLRPGDLDASPVAIVQEIDRQFREFEGSDVWQERLNRVVGGASLLGHALFAASTKQDFNDFRPSARAPDSLPVALDDYFAFRFDRRDSTIVLLVDEAQNLDDTAVVRRHLDALHGGVRARTTVLLACFGLTNTTDCLRELGLSRLATGHVRSIGALSDKDSERTVTGTLDAAFADLAFRDARRERWVGAAAETILAESANFPHHLANGCQALAEIVLNEGIRRAASRAPARQMPRPPARILRCTAETLGAPHDGAGASLLERAGWLDAGCRCQTSADGGGRLRRSSERREGHDRNQGAMCQRLCRAACGGVSADLAVAVVALRGSPARLACAQSWRRLIDSWPEIWIKTRIKRVNGQHHGDGTDVLSFTPFVGKDEVEKAFSRLRQALHVDADGHRWQEHTDYGFEAHTGSQTRRGKPLR